MVKERDAGQHVDGSTAARRAGVLSKLSTKNGKPLPKATIDYRAYAAAASVTSFGRSTAEDYERSYGLTLREGKRLRREFPEFR